MEIWNGFEGRIEYDKVNTQRHVYILKKIIEWLQ
jgi:hypothetical protein